METVSLQDINKASEVVKASPLVYQTALVRVPESLVPGVRLYAKLENMQNLGSFKVRGLVNKLEHVPEEVLAGAKCLVSMSSGNFGRALSYVCREKRLKVKILMPTTAPQSRVELVRSYGGQVELQHNADLEAAVSRHVKEQGMVFLHPFDDPHLIAGYGSLGLEILDQCHEQPDFVVVCCGGGALASGVGAAIKLSGRAPGTKVIAVEPITANTMYRSLREGRAVRDRAACSVATGLAAPFAGEQTYEHVKRFVDDVVLVSDEEIVQSVGALYGMGLVVEPAGAAAIAAVRCGRIAGMEGKSVVAVVTGSNISPHDLAELVKYPATV